MDVKKIDIIIRDGDVQKSFRGVESYALVVKCLEGGLVTREYSLSGGDVGWLVGKLYTVLRHLEHLMLGGKNDSN